ncbi:tRNA 2-selenouridine(34) synthase MnmH [Aliiroseovarius subalbicans]|uniref:tRNA 2-selenouridine(34) synthase MnmH n=1 Tax=Aliiroseovarius subalbicans TaxID=2925840 RepID=UPI001F57B88D|nr:tRNA 2-selenouridine(34) synthase MnmH [Aliiroseovarius subalbicans]MCI2397772.1 tRNA 2-selenouridine(34) synthase MnmH [Aliiroseovarius subalbicans]
MAHILTSLRDLSKLPFDEVIDVRAPAEYAEDHIPGAINLPVLSDAERARVGTIYVQEDRFLARKVGAALVARNAADHLEGPLADRTGGWRPLVYCWRGGQRSGSFASILAQVGWRVDLIDGGYKSFRRLVVETLYEQPLALRLILIDGGTGTAKTRLLEHLENQGAQVLDLEAMAAHRGSLFGPVAGGQPSQKSFESTLAMAMATLDPTRPVFIEAESNKIGRITLPPSLWAAMIGAEQIRLSAPLSARAGFLVTAYPDLLQDPARLTQTLDQLRRYHGHDQVSAWKSLADAGQYEALARALVATHYDPRYARVSRRKGPPLMQLELPDLSEATLADTAARITETAD